MPDIEIYQEERPWGNFRRFIENCPSTNTIMVLLNSKYKLLDMIKPDILYMVFYISEGIVEVFLKESNQSNEKLVQLRDGIIKRLADVYADDLQIKIKEKDENEVEGYNHLVNSKNHEDTILNENEKVCLSMRLEEGKTLKEIGEHFGFTRERARQIISSALHKINNHGTEPVNTKTSLEIRDISLVSESLKEQIDEIIENASKAYNIPVKEIKGKSRQQDLVVARHIAIYNLKNKLNLSYSAIGKIFDRDHTTIIHACNKIGDLISKED